MTYSVEKQEKSVVKFVFTLDKEDWEKAIAAAFQKDKNKFQIPGFRKGKAPRSFVEKVYGKGVFFETAINESIPGYYGKALDEHPELVPVANPEFDIEDLSDDGAKIAVYVTVKPEVKLGDYKGLTVEKNVYPVDKDAVESELKKAQERAGRLVDVEGRAAENGDTVVIDYSGSVDGVKFQGGTAEKQNLELGSGMFIPGFEEQVVGMNIGDEKDINVKFPENYGSADLAGKDAVFAIKLHEIKKKEVPALDDEFAKDVSEFDTLAEYKADVEKKLKESNEKRAQAEAENALIEKIADSSEVEIPDVMVEAQIDDQIQQFEYRLMYQGMNLDKYLEMIKLTREDLRKEYRESSIRNVKARLVLEAIITAEKLEVSPEDIDAKLQDFAKSSGKDFDEYKKTVSERQIDYIANELIYTKLTEFLNANNTYTDKVEAKKPATKKTATKKADESVEEKPAAKKTTTAKKTTSTTAKKTTSTTAKKATSTAKKTTSKKAE